MSDEGSNETWESPLPDWLLTGETKDAIDQESVGDWVVWTMGSAHLFNIDPGMVFWTRIPGAGRGQFVGDSSAQRLTRVTRWPVVDKTFLLWFDDPDRPMDVEQWRQSSFVRRIERVERDVEERGATALANGVLTSVHPSSECAQQPWGCWVHSPIEHPLSEAPIVWRDDRSLAERKCTHSLGHPDPQGAAYSWQVEGRDVTAHGCDGCCEPVSAELNQWLPD